jgi:hypothetical protein
LVSRAKTCRLCEVILLFVKDARWINDATSMTWEEAKTSMSRNLMIWIIIPVHEPVKTSFVINLGSPREPETWGAMLDFRKSLSKSYFT